MPPIEDDDDWTLEDEGPDERDLAPDNLGTVRCTNCRKLILEDSPRCPYCKEYQVEEGAVPGRRIGYGKPFWFLATVAVLLGMIAVAILFGWRWFWPT